MKKGKGDSMAGDYKRGFYERLKEFTGKNVSGLLLLAAFLLLLIYLIRPHSTFPSAVIPLACAAVFLGLPVINKRLFFNGRDLTVRTRVLGIRLKDKTYPYEDICKFILGRNYGFVPVKRYALYLDRDDEIIKITTVKDYKGCIELIKNIKGRSGKLIYDGTGEGYVSEDELIRDYYRLKTMVREVKEGGENEKRCTR
jgi:hypothetical protein